MQTATFVVQIQKLRHIVGIPCKTHPNILFCLFGHSQNGDCRWPNTAGLTQPRRPIWPRKLKPQIFVLREIPLGGVYYQGRDIHSQNIIRYLTLKHTFITQSIELHNLRYLDKIHHLATNHTAVSSNMRF